MLALAPEVTGCEEDERRPPAHDLGPRADQAPAADSAEGPVADGASLGDGGVAPGRYFADRFGITLASVYWGDLHSHSLYSYDAPACNAENGPEEACAFARDPAGVALDFIALTDHAEAPPEELTPPQDADLWQSLLRISHQQSNEDPAAGKVFIVFPGWEYTNTRGLAPSLGSVSGYGHKCVILKGATDAPVTRAASWMKGAGSEVLARTAEDLWAHLEAHRPQAPGAEGTALTIPHTTAMSGGEPLGPSGHLSTSDHATDWTVMDRDFVRNVEIYSKWGNSEGSPPGHCEVDDTATLVDFMAEEQDPIQTLRVLLQEKWNSAGDARFALSFVGGTDNHRGMPGNAVTSQCSELGMRYRGSVTGIVAPSLSRDALWSALWRRQTLACVTGVVRLPVLMAVQSAGEHLLMGAVGSHDGTARLRVHAAPAVERIEVLLDGCLVHSAEGTSLDLTLPLEPGRHFIYVRATRGGGDELQVAWTSPVYLR